MKAKAAKETRKPAKDAGKKKSAPKKAVMTTAKKGSTAVKSPSSAAAKKTGEKVKKTLPSKVVEVKKTSSAARKTGEKKKEKSSVREKRAAVIKKPAATAAPAKKTKAGTREKPAAGLIKKTVTAEKKQRKVASPLPAAAKVSSRSAGRVAARKKTGVKEKGRAAEKAPEVGKTAKREKVPSAALVQKKTAKTTLKGKKPAEGKRKKPAEEVAPAKKAAVKISAGASRKRAIQGKTIEKGKTPALKKKPGAAKTIRKTKAEKEVPAAKAPARKKAGSLIKTERPSGAKEPAAPPGPGVRPAVPARKYQKKEAEPLGKPEKAALKIFLPGKEAGEEDIQESFIAALPEEYGENALIAMVVDPNIVFIDWEIVPGEIAAREGNLVLRFYDVTGIEFDGQNANAVTDFSISRRVGNGFFEIRMPGREVIVEAGVMSPEGAFHAVVRSETVSFPFLLAFDDLGIVQKLLASGIPVGY
jgi:hypothetical protein